ncbi:MAG: DUF5107 domain-containing protein [Acidobacteriota bacterium]|nr:DUF5107 domain-containing protein [Acidobacteriota bacterium]
MSDTPSTFSSHRAILHGNRGAFATVILENSTIRVEILPELGGKIVSLLCKQTCREFLLQPPEEERGYRQPSENAKFEDYDTSGFDECIPTVTACRYPDGPFAGQQLPDHGDLWSMPWKFHTTANEVALEVRGRSLPYMLTRRMKLEENTLLLNYQITNLSDADLRFLWSAHPLLAVEPGAKILLPAEVRELEVNWSNDDRLGKSGDLCSWPETIDKFDRKANISTVAEPATGWADKLFTPRLSEGFCALFYPKSNESLVFRFDPKLVPFVGLWICSGGWPLSRAPKHFTVALEPCTGRPDSLEEAIKRGEYDFLPGRETKSWWLRMQVISGKPQK